MRVMKLSEAIVSVVQFVNVVLCIPVISFPGRNLLSFSFLL